MCILIVGFYAWVNCNADLYRLHYDFDDSLIGTIRSDVASKVMMECTRTIKELVGLYPLIDKLVEKRLISEAEKHQVIDHSCGLSADQRMDVLLHFVKATIKYNGEGFRLFVEIIKQEDTIKTDRLAQTLLDTYRNNN